MHACSEPSIDIFFSIFVSVRPGAISARAYVLHMLVLTTPLSRTGSAAEPPSVQTLDLI